MRQSGGPRGDRDPVRTAASGGNGAQNGADAAMLPDDPGELEQLIDDRRQRLAGTVDELARRVHPRMIARRGVQDAGARLRAAAYTDDGRLRVERVAAVATATVTLLVLLLRRYRSR